MLHARWQIIVLAMGHSIRQSGSSFLRNLNFKLNLSFDSKLLTRYHVFRYFLFSFVHHFRIM